jgi:hypothetical protein
LVRAARFVFLGVHGVVVGLFLVGRFLSGTQGLIKG